MPVQSFPIHLFCPAASPSIPSNTLTSNPQPNSTRFPPSLDFFPSTFVFAHPTDTVLTKGNKQDREDLEKEREKHKHDSVQKAKDGKGHWKEELASDSEEAVAGDRHDHSMEEMQKMGEQKGEKDKKS